MKPKRHPSGADYSDADIVRRRDEAVRRALNTPPKPHKDMKLGKRKPTSSQASRKKT